MGGLAKCEDRSCQCRGNTCEPKQDVTQITADHDHLMKEAHQCKLHSDCYSEGGLCRSKEEGCACHEDTCHKIPEDVVMSGLCELDRDCGLYFKCFLDREAGHCSCSQGTCQQKR